MKKLISELRRLEELFINGVISKENYLRELDELIKNAKNKDEISLIHKYKDLEV